LAAIVRREFGRKDRSRVEIDVLRPKDLTAELAARWRELQRLDPAWDSPFLSPCWSRAVEHARGERGVRVAVLSEGGEARGFFSACVAGSTAIAAGGPMCDYEALVAEPSLAIDPAALVRALGVQRLDFSHMLESQAAFAPYARGHCVSWVVDLPDGYEAYATERRAEGVTALKDLEKKRRKAERELGPAVFTARSASRADFERLVELKRGQYRATGQTDVLGAGWTLRLLQDLFSARGAGIGALFTLRLGDQLAACQFHLLGETTIHAWMIGHESEYERYSPGLLLFQDILKWMDETNFNRLDLGYGDYRFKRELSNRQIGLMDGFVGVPSAATLVREAAWGVRRAAEALPLGRVSALPGKAMRRMDLLRGLR
jgi:CelD/BcsL family acetyltransferase involved in cellulose biosynthesis